MSDRSPLRKQIEDAWESVISDVYPQRLINSERGLQIFFCHALLNALDETNRRLFVEPTFTDVSDKQQRTPDILICNTRQIIAVIELKYQPRVPASWQKDMKTLDWFASQSGELRLSNDRFLGPTTGAPKSYSLADDAVLCWAGLYRTPLVQTPPTENIRARFLGLHAVTSTDEVPVVHRLSA